jgi:hypothetical protein
MLSCRSPLCPPRFPVITGLFGSINFLHSTSPGKPAVIYRAIRAADISSEAGGGPFVSAKPQIRHQKVGGAMFAKEKPGKVISALNIQVEV